MKFKLMIMQCIVIITMHLDRFKDNIDDTDIIENNKEIKYYNKLYGDSQMFIYDQKSIIPYDPFFLLSRKLYHKLLAINCNNNFLVFTGNEPTYHNRILSLKHTYLFIILRKIIGIQNI